MAWEGSNDSGSAFAASRRMAKATGFGSLRHVEVTHSTNADLAAEARMGAGGYSDSGNADLAAEARKEGGASSDSNYTDLATKVPKGAGVSSAILVADHQLEGKGRLGRVWQSVPGQALLVSFRIPIPPEVATHAAAPTQIPTTQTPTTYTAATMRAATTQTTATQTPTTQDPVTQDPVTQDPVTQTTAIHATSTHAATQPAATQPATNIHAAARQAVMAVGLAARQAVQDLVGEVVAIKWPNDLIVEEGPNPGKLGGLLAEYSSVPLSCVVVGIGINVMPLDEVAEATSLAECGMQNAKDTCARDLLLAKILEELSNRLPDVFGFRGDFGKVSEHPRSESTMQASHHLAFHSRGEGKEQTRSVSTNRQPHRNLLEEARQHCATLGRWVSVEQLDGSKVVGQALDLDNDGRLLVRAENGETHTFDTGDVFHLRHSR